MRLRFMCSLAVCSFSSACMTLPVDVGDKGTDVGIGKGGAGGSNGMLPDLGGAGRSALASAVLIHRRGRARARPRVRGSAAEAGGGSGGASGKAEPGPRSRAPRDRSRQEAGMWVGVGRQPWGSVVDSAMAKRFRISQLKLRRCD